MKKGKVKPKKSSVKNPGGNVTDKIDRALLHQYLWKYRDRSGFMSHKSGEMAGLLGITIHAMSAILKEMCDKGYLKKLGNSKYIVIEPNITAWTADGETQQESMF